MVVEAEDVHFCVVGAVTVGGGAAGEEAGGGDHCYAGGAGGLGGVHGEFVDFYAHEGIRGPAGDGPGNATEGDEKGCDGAGAGERSEDHSRGEHDVGD